MMVFVLWRNLMKLIYVSSVCILVAMNSVFAMLCDKEGPSGEYNRYFFLKKETVINHLGSVKPRHPYGRFNLLSLLLLKVVNMTFGAL